MQRKYVLFDPVYDSLVAILAVYEATQRPRSQDVRFNGQRQEHVPKIKYVKSDV